MMHVIDDDVWTPKIVGDLLIAAIKWAQQTGGRVTPRMYGQGLPDPALTSDERALEEWPQIYEIEEFDPPKHSRRSLSPAKVSQMERVLEWPMTYLTTLEATEPGAFRVFKVWVTCKLIKGVSFDKACDQKGWSRATAYRKKDKALSMIAQGLARDGILRGRH